MTAFAREESRTEVGELIWEMRSVNHRYLEVFVRLPDELRALEPVVRERIGKALSRGKVECSLKYRPTTVAAETLRVNPRMVEQLNEAGRDVAGLLAVDFRPGVMEVLRWPGVLEETERDITPVQQQALALLDTATAGLVESRRKEGARLSDLIEQRCEAMQTLVLKARERMPDVLAAVRERIRTRLEEVMESLDGTRLEQEMALLAQRLDVDEEMDRLSAHLDEVASVLKRDEPVGRRLDFLMQELNRESNTLGSKSADVETTRIAVELKVLIEQMREQVQNIE